MRLVFLLMVGCTSQCIPDLDVPDSDSTDAARDGMDGIDAASDASFDTPLADVAHDSRVVDVVERADVRPDGTARDAGSAESLLLYTTLDSEDAVANPIAGDAAGHFYRGSFVDGPVDDALYVPPTFVGVAYRQRVGDVRNIDFERGTIELWYQPQYDSDDSRSYDIFGAGDPHDSLAPGFVLKKEDSLTFVVHDTSGAHHEHNVTDSRFDWSAGDWVLIRVTWDMTLPETERNVHMYLNDVEQFVTGSYTHGVVPMPDEHERFHIYFGTRLINCCRIEHAFDDIRIWDRAISP